MLGAKTGYRIYLVFTLAVDIASRNVHLRDFTVSPISTACSDGARRAAARSAGFSRIKKIPYQAPPTQLGPRKCTF